jgi:hypothetical protein
MSAPARAGFIGQQKGRAPVIDYNEVNLLETDDAKRAKLEYWIAKRVGEALIGAYNNRQWECIVDLDARVLVVKCPSLSLTKGYYLNLGRPIHELCAAAVRAGGEIMERYGITRGRITDSKMFDALPQRRDEVIAKDAAPEPIQKKVHI